ncbi:MAG: tetratricopeptide repeat protein [Taibaiella sp.]|nr:tetratricopeptide repeat protein [Taibaiella sp.]
MRSKEDQYIVMSIRMNSRLIFSLLFTLLLGSPGMLRAQKMPMDYFDEGQALFERGKYEEALTSYMHIVTHNPRNVSFGDALFESAKCHYELGNYDSAIALARKFFFMDTLESHRCFSKKYFSCSLMSSVFLKKHMLDTSLFYLGLADSVHTFISCVWNCQLYSPAEVIQRIHISIGYARVFIERSQMELAFRELIQYIFDEEAQKTSLVEELRKLLAVKSDVKLRFDDALAAHYKEKLHDSSDYYHLYMNFEGAKIELPKAEGVDQPDLARIRNSSFYKMIGAL